MIAKSKYSDAIFKGKLAEIFVKIGIAEPIEQEEETKDDVSILQQEVIEKPKRTYQKKEK